MKAFNVLAWALAIILSFAVLCSAQTTVGIFAGTATTAGTPIATPVQYAPLCDRPAFTESPPIENPTHAYYTDPARPGRDCELGITAQVTALPVGSYKAAYRLGPSGAYGLLSTVFTRTLPPVIPPPVIPPPTAGCVDGGQLYAPGTWLEVSATAKTIWDNRTIAARNLYMARIAQLAAAGFEVTPILNSSTVYLLVFCRGVS
jgi:hypothetical protein